MSEPEPAAMSNPQPPLPAESTERPETSDLSAPEPAPEPFQQSISASAAPSASPSASVPVPASSGPPPQSIPTYQPIQDATSNNLPPAQTQAPIGSPLPSTMPPMPSMGQYNPGYAPMGLQGGQMSYQLPGNPRSRAHQKEVKRRTKTGCLTCRRRRIKVGS